MNYPGVIAGDTELLAKIAAAGERRVDGHAPGLTGPALDAYLAAGIESDHECTMLAEAQEKRRKGMWIFVRQGSASKNLADLIPMSSSTGPSGSRCAATTGSRTRSWTAGHVNDCVRLAVACGVRVEDALVLATANPAQYHNLHHLGWLAPGYQADVLCFDTLDADLARPGLPGRAAGGRGRAGAARVPCRRRPRRTGCAGRSGWRTCPVRPELTAGAAARRSGEGHRHRRRHA